MPHDLQKLYSTAQQITDLFAQKDRDSFFDFVNELKNKAEAPDAQEDDLICANMAMIFKCYVKAFNEPPWKDVNLADIPFELRMSKLIEVYEKFIYILDNLDDPVASVSIINGDAGLEVGSDIYKFLELRAAAVCVMLKLSLRYDDAKDLQVVDSYKREPYKLLFEVFVEIEQAARSMLENFDWNKVEDRNKLLDTIYLLDNICRYIFPNLKEVKQLQQQCLYKLLEYYPVLSKNTFEELLLNVKFNSDLQSEKNRTEDLLGHDHDEEMAELFLQERDAPSAKGVAENALDELYKHDRLSLASAEYLGSLPGLSSEAQRELGNISFFININPSAILTEEIMQNMFSFFIQSVFIFKPEVAKHSEPVAKPTVVDLDNPKNLFLFNLLMGKKKIQDKKKPIRPFSKFDSEFKNAAKKYRNFDNHNVEVLKKRINFLSFLEDHITEPTSILELLAAKYALQEAYIPQLTLDDLAAYRLKVSDYSVHVDNYMQELRWAGNIDNMTAGLKLSHVKRTYHSQLLNLIDEVYAQRSKGRPMEADMKHNEDGVAPFNTRFPRI